MDFDDIVKIVDKVKVLEARLAVEAERDAARAKRDAARAEVAHMKREQQAMIMQHRHDIRDLGQLLQDERCKVAAVEAAWYAAQDGKARAVECLKEIDEYNGGADSVLEDEYVTHRLMEVMEGGASPLAWLAQQRREAAVEALEKLATDLRQDQGESALHDVDSLRGILRTRAAALRAGEVGND